MRHKVLAWLLAAALLTPGRGGAADLKALPTNMDLLAEAVTLAVEEAVGQMTGASAPPAGPVLLVAETAHKGNWLVEHLLSEGLLRRGFRVTLDSTRAAAGGPRLSYRVHTLRVSGQAGLLSSHVSRRAEVVVSFRGSQGETLVWQDESSTTVQDRIPASRVDVLKNKDHAFAQTELQRQTWSRFAEPVVVSSVLGGLTYMFFSNR